MQAEKYITVREYATEHGKTTDQVRRAYHAGEIQGRRRGNRIEILCEPEKQTGTIAEAVDKALDGLEAPKTCADCGCPVLDGACMCAPMATGAIGADVSHDLAAERARADRLEKQLGTMRQAAVDSSYEYEKALAEVERRVETDVARHELTHGTIEALTEDKRKLQLRVHELENKTMPPTREENNMLRAQLREALAELAIRKAALAPVPEKPDNGKVDLCRSPEVVQDLFRHDPRMDSVGNHDRYVTPGIRR